MGLGSSAAVVEAAFYGLLRRPYTRRHSRCRYAHSDLCLASASFPDAPKRCSGCTI